MKRTNNFHCFEGNGLRYWREMASGAKPVWKKPGPDGDVIDYEVDPNDGFARRDGGLQVEDIVYLGEDVYYRFFSTQDRNKYGPDAFTRGRWWIGPRTLAEIVHWAGDRDISIAAAAQQLLCIPPNWSDCAYVGKAKLKVDMRAFRGAGKPATGSVSPDSHLRKERGIKLMMSPPQLAIKQYFVPGRPELLGVHKDPETGQMVQGVFEFQGLSHVLKRGSRLTF